MRLFEEVRQDARYAVRALWRSPGFAVVAVLTLALGIGANTTIFSVFNASVLRPLPYHAPASLVFVDLGPGHSAEAWLMSAWRDGVRSVPDIAGFDGPRAATLVAGGEPDQVQSAFITWNFLSVLGEAPAAGRAFVEEDGLPGAPSVALLSHTLWVNRFAGDASIIGRTVRVSGEAVTVVGIMPPTFRFPATGALTAASFILDSQPDVMRVAGPRTRLTVIGRLAPGVTAAAATEELLAIYQQAAGSLLDDGKPEYSPSQIDRLQLAADPLQERLAGHVREQLWLAMGAVGFVLLVACANVANLLLARASARHRELAVRSALGAGAARLVRLLLTESMLLALAGAALGLLLAVSASGVARMVLADRLPHVDTIAIDWAVLAFTVAVAAVTGLLCGVSSIPAATGASLLGVFGGDTLAVTGRSTMRRILLSTEVAMTFVLVVGAALLVQTLWNLSSKDRGFEADRLLTVRVSPGVPRDLDRTDRRADARYFAQFFGELRNRLERIPGVVSAGAVSRAPLTGTVTALPNIAVDGRGLADESSTPVAFVTPGYVRTMQIPVIAGRDFDERDRLGAERVVIVNEAFQRRFAPDGNIVGARISSISEGFTVIGLTEDVPDRSLRDAPEPLVMAPLAQMPAGNITWSSLTFVLRTAGGDPVRLAPAVRKEIWAIDRDIVISEVATMDERVAHTLRAERDGAVLFGLFAVAALVLAAIGVYGVAAYAIAQRTREIGIRVALGATRRDVSQLVVSQTLVPTLIGLGVGVGAAAVGTQLVASMVYGLTPLDAMTFAVAVVVLLSVALGATWLPARRATRIDPLAALRSQ
jgi:predicted permease